MTRLRGLNPDVVLSSAFVNEAAVVEPGAGEWMQAIDAAVERLTRAR